MAGFDVAGSGPRGLGASGRTTSAGESWRKLIARPVRAGVFVLGLGTSMQAQGPIPVPLDAAVYRHIDALAGAGLIDSLIVGQRPYSQREVVRLLREAQRNLRRVDSGGWAERAIANDLSVYDRTTDDERTTALIRIGAQYLDSPFRAAPTDSNGRVDAVINPLVAFREGRPVYDGATATVEPRFGAVLERHVALFLQPRLTSAAGRGTHASSTLRLQAGAMNLLFGNLTIEAGRDAIVFGQARTGGLLLSRNGPSLDMVRVSNDRPAALPWIFGVFGPLRGTLFVADLGAHQNYPHARLIGYKASAAIHPRFELGIQVVDQMGGSGSPGSPFRDRVYDVVPLIDIFRSSDYQFSNKFAGIDFRWRVPRAAGFELFFDGAVDDLDARRWKSTLLEDAGYISGLSFACVLECGALGVRVEYHQTGIRYYTHTQFTSGLAQNGTLLGDPLGPRGLGAYLTIDRMDPRYGTFSLAGAFEARSGNRYVAHSTGPEDRGFHFELYERRPAEKRARTTLSWAQWERRGLSSRAVLGIERVHNFDFAAGNRRWNALAEVGLEWRP